VGVVCCLCDELITHPEKSYRMWCVVVCDLEKAILVNEEAKAHQGAIKPREKENIRVYVCDIEGN